MAVGKSRRFSSASRRHCVQWLHIGLHCHLWITSIRSCFSKQSSWNSIATQVYTVGSWNMVSPWILSLNSPRSLTAGEPIEDHEMKLELGQRSRWCSSFSTLTVQQHLVNFAAAAVVSLKSLLHATAAPSSTFVTMIHPGRDGFLRNSWSIWRRSSFWMPSQHYSG